MFGLVPVQFGGKFSGRSHTSGLYPPAPPLARHSGGLFLGFNIILIVYFNLFSADVCSFLTPFENLPENLLL